MSKISKNINILEFSQQVSSNIPTEVDQNISLKAYWIISSIFVQSDTKTIRKVHKLHKNDNIEVFRIIWSHSEVFSKRNAATLSSQNVMQSSFFRFFSFFIVLELVTKTLGNCTDIASKKTKSKKVRINFHILVND